jgi:hypothetical protein
MRLQAGCATRRGRRNRGLLFIALAALFVPGSSLRGDASLPKRIELSLSAGYGKSGAEGLSLYRNGWRATDLSLIVEDNRFELYSRAAIFGGGFCSFFFKQRIGVQAGFGYLKSQMKGETLFTLTDPRNTAASRQDRWPARGEITAVPLCLNLIGRVGGERVQGFASIGASLFLNSFFAAVPAGISSQISSDGPVNAFEIPTAVPDETWVSFGGNIGAGIDYKLGPSAALTAEVRYFFCPAKSFHWRWQPGEYAGLGQDHVRLVFGQEQARQAEARTTALNVRPSFVQISAGVKFFFPGPSPASSAAGGRFKN